MQARTILLAVFAFLVAISAVAPANAQGPYRRHHRHYHRRHCFYRHHHRVCR